MSLSIKIRLLFIALFAILSQYSNAKYEKSVSINKQIDLFVLGGQSNAQGWQGNAEFYPVDSLNIDQSIKLNYSFVGTSDSEGKWIPMQAQKGRFPKGHFGPEVSFARKLKASGYNPAVFKYTCGSTSIHTFWKTPGAGGQYDQMVDQLSKAIFALERDGYSVTIRSFIWIQGESDATKDAANNYYKALKEIITHFRNYVAKNDTLPIILGLDEQHSYVQEYPVVLESQKRLARELKNTVFSSMIDLPKADATHLTPLGLVEQGNRLFEAFIKLIELRSNEM